MLPFYGTKANSIAPDVTPSHLGLFCLLNENSSKNGIKKQRTNDPENAHLKPDLGVLSHHEMTLNTHTPLLTS